MQAKLSNSHVPQQNIKDHVCKSYTLTETEKVFCKRKQYKANFVTLPKAELAIHTAQSERPFQECSSTLAQLPSRIIDWNKYKSKTVFANAILTAINVRQPLQAMTSE